MKFLVFLSLLFIFSCTNKFPPTEDLSVDQLVQRGQSIYKSNCIACHNADPDKEGSAGPALHGASLELLEAKILKSTYPAEYRPKRDTKLMPKFAHLEKEILSIHRFLNQ